MQATHRTGPIFEQVKDHQFKALTDDLLLFCKRLEGHELLWKQMAFTKAFMGLTRQACLVEDLRSRDAATRKMNLTDVEFVSASRKMAVDFQHFTYEQDIKLKPSDTPLFPTGVPSPSLPQVGKAWDISGAEGWLASIRNGTNSIIDGWVADVHGVCKLTESYDITGWEIAKDTLFAEESKVSLEEEEIVKVQRKSKVT